MNRRIVEFNIALLRLSGRSMRDLIETMNPVTMAGPGLYAETETVKIRARLSEN